MKRPLMCISIAALLSVPAMAMTPSAPLDDATAVVLAQPAAPDLPDAPQVADPELAPVLEALGQVFTSNGSINWIVAAPLLVWVVVWLLRRFGGQAVPWLASKTGGIVLALLSALALAFLHYGMSGGGPITGAVVLTILVQTVYAWLGGMGLHSGLKNAKEAITASGDAAAAGITTGDQAHAKLQELGRGPQP